MIKNNNINKYFNKYFYNRGAITGLNFRIAALDRKRDTSNIPNNEITYLNNKIQRISINIKKLITFLAANTQYLFKKLNYFLKISYMFLVFLFVVFCMIVYLEYLLERLMNTNWLLFIFNTLYGNVVLIFVLFILSN